MCLLMRSTWQFVDLLHTHLVGVSLQASSTALGPAVGVNLAGRYIRGNGIHSMSFFFSTPIHQSELASELLVCIKKKLVVGNVCKQHDWKQVGALPLMSSHSFFQSDLMCSTSFMETALWNSL